MHLAMIYMASGFASRFGENKLLVPFRGKPLYLHGMEHLAEAARLLEQEGAAEISLLAVSQYGEILAKGREMGYIPVPNSRSREGITASLRLGTLGAGEAEAYLYFVADQPFMGGETIRAFVSGFLKSKKGIGCAARGSGRGSPVIFSSKYRESLLGLSGDKGGRQIMERFPRDIWAMQVKGEPVRQVVNATGAGDAFVGGLVYAQLQGLSPEETMLFSTAAARMAIAHQNTINPNISAQNVWDTVQRARLVVENG